MDQSKAKRKLASKLHEVRNTLGITQLELQKEGIITQSRLSKIENGELNISAIMLRNLAQRYGKSMDYFFDYETHNTPK